MASRRSNGAVRSKVRGTAAWSCPWAPVQTASHIAIFWSIAWFAFYIMPAWTLQEASTFTISYFASFWAVFAVTLGLYFYVCTANTKYVEKPHLSGITSTMYESRRCEVCEVNITKTRVKHCHPCGKCVAGFDHHCRYLNVCIAGKTYNAWFTFVIGLLVLMTLCSYSAVDAIRHNERESSGWGTTLLVFLYVEVVVSSLCGVFVACLLLQHLYLIYEGLTTLEYVKNQDAGFPSLPPEGWRGAVSCGQCFVCGNGLEVTECEEADDVWFCSICQVDLSRAEVDFFSCHDCDNIAVCFLCRRIADSPYEPVVTRRVASLRRRINYDPHMGSREPLQSTPLNSLASSSSTPRGMGKNCRDRPCSLSSGGSRMNSRGQSRSRFPAMFASVEGHSGDGEGCGTCCGGSGDANDVDSDDESASMAATEPDVGVE